MRKDLRDGQWAELRERISHADDKELKKLGYRSQEDRGLMFDWQTLLVRKFLRRWSILDVDGNEIPADAPDAVDRMPDDVVEDLFRTATDLYSEATVPNSPTPPSSAD